MVVGAPAFDEQVPGKAQFEAAADCPPVEGAGGGGCISDRGEDVGLRGAHCAVSKAAGRIDQGTVECHAEAAAKGADPGNRFLRGEAGTGAAAAEADDVEWTGDGRRTLDRRSLEVR